MSAHPDDRSTLELQLAQQAAELRVLRERVRELEAREHAPQSLLREQHARKEADAQKRLLYSLFMQAPMMIAVLRGPAHVIELANPPMCAVWGKAEQDVLNRPLREILTARGGVPLTANEVFQTGVPHIGREQRVALERGRGPETLYCDFVYSPFRSIAGELEGIFLIASDVTAQVTARDQVEGLREAAESANRAKDEFLAMLGHELRNPLSPILTALQLMKLQGPAGADRARQVIERQVGHMIRLVDDLLDVSRIARGKVELKTELVELADVVAKAVEMASPLIEQHAHRLSVEIPRQGLQTVGDATRLAQVVSNLLTNAAKYTPPRGQIRVSAERVDSQIVLRVADNGSGIAADVLPRIFELFMQARQELDRSQGGLGLGLTIVRNLVERHGGTVSARSDGPGRGSEFVVRLPAAASARG